ncbi:hypothetical protein BJ508DRAFT_363057 [Ascobolus immersus RN42]|uniref:LysM domain-containing protein n=1 Tax=Ascobolus immersus RN42 TaxID=1160509 RepID=A0A3N4ID54_ASCIM|nr:hypothetical protein BJ508DRAFT_363057 [Ascobolus immersus RN42]
MASFLSYASTSYALELSPPDYFDSDSTPTKACIPPSCAVCTKELKTEHEKEENEKGQENLQWGCCQRFVCGPCVMKNNRYKTYCPYCQLPTTTGPDSNSLVSKLPPSYETTLHITRSLLTPPPSYSGALAKRLDGIHHFIKATDTLPSLSLAYDTPLTVLRALNNLHSDNLLHAHRSIFIPSSHYQGPSLSPDPPGGEKEEEKRVLVKRFQCLTKCVEVRVAEWYLENCDWNLEEAVEKWGLDTNWERAFGSLGNGPGFAGLRSSGSGFRVGGCLKGFRDETSFGVNGIW